jgi:hypothetical protein
MFTSCHTFKQTKIYVFILCILKLCVGPVCVRDTSLIHHGRECTRLDSATRRVSFYTILSSLVGGVGRGRRSALTMIVTRTSLNDGSGDLHYSGFNSCSYTKNKKGMDSNSQTSRLSSSSLSPSSDPYSVCESFRFSSFSLRV